MTNETLRFDLCRYIITGVRNEFNISTYDESCNLKAACFSEFGDKFKCSAKSEIQVNTPSAEADCVWKWIAVTALVVIMLLIAVIVVKAIYFSRESKKQNKKIADLEKKLRTASNILRGPVELNERPPSMIGQNRIIFDEADLNSVSTEATGFESSEHLLSNLRVEVDGDSSQQSMAHTRGTIHLPPASTTLPLVFFSNITQSNESLNDSIASSGSEHNEDSQTTFTTSNEHDNNHHHGHQTETDSRQNQRSFHTIHEHDNNNHHGHQTETDSRQNQRSCHTINEHDNNNHHGHLAETDNQNQRSIHLPSTEPSDLPVTVVTSVSSVYQPQRRGLE